MTPDAPEPTPKPKRKRRTKAEMEAARAEQAAQAAAEADKPIDPLIWIIVGGGLLFVAAWTWFDPVTFAEAGYNPSIFQIVPLLMIRIFGRTPAVVILTVLGAIPLVWGIVGWVRKRST